MLQVNFIVVYIIHKISVLLKISRILKYNRSLFLLLRLKKKLKTFRAVLKLRILRDNRNLFEHGDITNILDFFEKVK